MTPWNFTSAYAPLKKCVCIWSSKQYTPSQFSSFLSLFMVVRVSNRGSLEMANWYAIAADPGRFWPCSGMSKSVHDIAWFMGLEPRSNFLVPEHDSSFNTGHYGSHSGSLTLAIHFKLRNMTLSWLKLYSIMYFSRRNKRMKELGRWFKSNNRSHETCLDYKNRFIFPYKSWLSRRWVEASRWTSV